MNPAITDPPLIDGRPMTPEEEVRFWRFFYAESQRLFGDKEGTLESLTAKAMRLLEEDAGFFARYRVPIYEVWTPDNKKVEMQKKHDERKRKLWKKQYNPSRLASEFDLLTNPAYYGDAYYGDTIGVIPNPAYLGRIMSKDDAIGVIKEAFRFPSAEAVYKALQRAGVKGLPPTWPK